MALPMIGRILKRKILKYIVFTRQGSSVCDDSVRVRFAPSPTGMLHIGGLRTALFNYLFAKSRGGSFILRIEDTDQTRKVLGAVEKLEEILDWAGLKPDESPSVGGSYGPYMQSERLQLYQDHVDKLVKSGHAYKCFCTAKRLDLLRREAARRGEKPGYDNKCRHLTQDEIDDKLAKNIAYAIRFKYEALQSPWTDLVFGEVHTKSVGDTLEGDFVIMKSDGYPTYHFANVVDDHCMEVSHVLRGEEWSISTPKHIQMYAAFGWQPPQYAHMPLILNSDGTKLSKRQNDIQVDEFRRKNPDPNPLLNYITTVNGGFKESTEGKTLSEMINIFSVDKLSRHSSRLQPETLENMNRRHLRRYFYGKRRQEVIDNVRSLVSNKYFLPETSHVLENSYIERLLELSLEHRISCLEDLLEQSFEFIWVVPSTEHLRKKLGDHIDINSAILSEIINKLKATNEFKNEVIATVLMCHCKEMEIKPKGYMTTLRQCISTHKTGPSIGEMMEMLGRDETLRRLKMAADIVNNMDK